MQVWKKIKLKCFSCSLNSHLINRFKFNICINKFILIYAIHIYQAPHVDFIDAICKCFPSKASLFLSYLISKITIIKLIIIIITSSFGYIMKRKTTYKDFLRQILYLNKKRGFNASQIRNILKNYNSKGVVPSKNVITFNFI